MRDAIERMNRILSDLDDLAGYFENAGFEEQSGSLDVAAEAIQGTRDGLAGLAVFPSRKRRQHAKAA